MFESFPVVLQIALGIMLALIVYGTVKQTRWGINMKPLHCPACGTPVPRVRTPTSTKEAMWGGMTCPRCGCEMDKWGRKIPAA